MGVALPKISWGALAEQAPAPEAQPARLPLTILPVLSYDLPVRRPQTSWRGWGGIQNSADAQQECARIDHEFQRLKQASDFPIQLRPLVPIHAGAKIPESELEAADAVVMYAAGGWTEAFDTVLKSGKPLIFFLRHRSGPVSLWYEIVSPHYLRQRTDRHATVGVDSSDVVIDSLEELTWRLRALCGLKNAVGARIVAIGGPGGWATPSAPENARTKFHLDIRTASYDDLGKLIREARADKSAVADARERADTYLRQPRVKLETDRGFVENAFLLERIFRGIMAAANSRALTINGCMSTIMPMAETTACLPLSLINDSGLLAFCESDFVVIPAGLLLAGISGRPQFLNDPTFPHQGVITLAHCTGPRRMDGRTSEPVRILTHFESDYGAAPKVEMRKGQVVTSIIPDFQCERWAGFTGRIADAPFLPICRCQIDVSYEFPDARLADHMPGFHWMTCYGDYTREVGYALKRIPIAFDDLG